MRRLASHIDAEARFRERESAYTPILAASMTGRAMAIFATRAAHFSHGRLWAAARAFIYRAAANAATSGRPAMPSAAMAARPATKFLDGRSSSNLG